MPERSCSGDRRSWTDSTADRLRDAEGAVTVEAASTVVSSDRSGTNTIPSPASAVGRPIGLDRRGVNNGTV